MSKENEVLGANDIIVLKSPYTGEIYQDFSPGTADHGFWINDLYFEVPPERIFSQEENAYLASQALRTSNSSKIPASISSEIFTVAFNIPHKTSILNIDRRASGPSNTGKRGGILDLILQFRNLSFFCIENAYIRAKLKIPASHNMVFAAHNLALSTSPGEPNTIVGNLTISPISYAPYSDRWYFKKYWISKEGLSLEDVNSIYLENRVPGEKPSNLTDLLRASNSSDELEDKQVVNPAIIGLQTSDYNNIVSPTYQDIEDLHMLETEVMLPALGVKYACESEPFKSYVDWLHFKNSRRRVNTDSENAFFDFNQISQWGSADHNIGNSLTLKWREFKSIEIDPVVADKIRLYIKRRLALFRSRLFKGRGGVGRSSSASAVPALPSSPITSTDPNAVTAFNPFGNAAIARYTEFGQLRRTTRGTGYSVIEGGKIQKASGYWRFHQGVDVYPNAGPDDYVNLITPFKIRILRNNTFFGSNSSKVQNTSKRVLLEGTSNRGGSTHQNIIFDTSNQVQIYRFGDSKLKKDTSNTGLEVAGEILEGPLKGRVIVFQHCAATDKSIGNAIDGQIVNAGTHIGYMGGTGIDDDPIHLHLEIRKNINSVKIQDKIDPGLFLETVSAQPVPVTELDIYYREAGVSGTYETLNKNSPNDGTGTNRLPAVTPSASEEEYKKIRGILEDAIASLPKTATDTERVGFGNYLRQVEQLKREGWQIYSKDLTVFDLFYQDRELSITVNGAYQEVDNNNPLVCDFISGTSFNVFKKLPIIGVSTPTAQLIGKQDNSFVLSFKGNGLNTVKQLDVIKDTLKKQGILYKYIPESYVLRVENNFINAFGDCYFVINSLESSTVPELPGSYSLEMRLTGHDLNVKNTFIKKESPTSNMQIYESFLKELTSDSEDVGRDYSIKLVKKREDAFASIEVKAPTIGGSVSGGLTTAQEAFLMEIAATVNLCTKLATFSSRHPYPSAELQFDPLPLPRRERKLLSYFVDKYFFINELGALQEEDILQRYFLSSTRQGNIGFPPSNSESWRRFLSNASSSLDTINPPIWDWTLEGVPQVYDLEPNGIRLTAWTALQGENNFTYADAKSRWLADGYIKTLSNPGIMKPYIRAHRAINAMVKEYFDDSYVNDLDQSGALDIRQGASGARSGTVEERRRSRRVSGELQVIKRENYDEQNILAGEVDFEIVKAKDFNIKLGSGYMKYVWNYLVIPYLNNCLNFQSIYSLATETPYFPETRSLLVKNQNLLSSSNYEDILIPYHPFWNKNNKLKEKGPAYTDPDFYLVNPGTDTFQEDNSSKRIELPLNSKLSPHEAYSLYTQLQIEYAGADIQALRETAVPLNTESARGQSERAPDQQYQGVIFSYDNNANLPKTEQAPKEPKPSNKETATSAPTPDSPEGMINARDLYLYFGANVDFVSSLSANVRADDGRFLNSRLANYKIIDYDFYNNQDFILRLRNSASQSLQETAENQRGNPGDEAIRNAKVNIVNDLFIFDEKKAGMSDNSAYINFSNTRYPTYLKVLEAKKSLGRKKLAARRAYPVVKVYFIEEDDIYNKDYIEFDEIYSFSQVESLEITESRKRPASVARIVFLDPHGILSGFNQWTKASSPTFATPENAARAADDLDIENETTNRTLRDTEYEQADFSFRLASGVKIKICLGYSNDPNKLEEVFLGEVSTVELGGSSDRIEVVAIGYGAELVAKTKGLTEEEASVTYNDTFDLLAHLMFEPEVIHFGKKKFDSVPAFGEEQSIKQNQIIYSETFAIGGILNANKPGGFPGYYWLSNLDNSSGIDTLYDDITESLRGSSKILKMEPFLGPQDDNLYPPSYLPKQGYYFQDKFFKYFGGVSADGDIRIGSGEKDIVAGSAIGGTVGLVAGGWAALYLSATLLVAGAPLLLGLGAVALAGALVGAVLGATIGATAQITVSDYFSKDENKDQGTELIEIVDPDALKYNIFYSTIWDIFDEMTLRHPGYVKHPRIYRKSNRMTMFFGLPDQNMWQAAGDPLDVFKAQQLFKEMAASAKVYVKNGNSWQESANGQLPAGAISQDRRAIEATGEGDGATRESRQEAIVDNLNSSNATQNLFISREKMAQFIKLSSRRFKPFRRWHNINSITDIISNDIEATAEGWYTEVQVQYTSTSSFGADSAAEDAAEKLDGKSLIENANSLVNWDTDRVVSKKMSIDLSPQFIRSTTFSFVNAKSLGLAKSYARGLLIKQAKEMYKGSITILGNPAVRPYDVIMLSDTYNNIYGPIEVEEISHIFSAETGFITVVYPDVFVIAEDTMPYKIMNGIHHSLYARTEYYIENSLAMNPIWGNIGDYTTEARIYQDTISRVMRAYGRDAENSARELAMANDLVSSLGTIAGGVGAATGLAVGIQGGALVGGVPGAVVGAIGGAVIGGALAYFYASAKLTNIMLNYLQDSRALLMVPLSREGQPMLAGINIGFSTGMRKSPLSYMRQYIMDGSMGRSLEEADLLMQHSRIYERNGGRLNNWVASSQLGLERWGQSWDNAFSDLGDFISEETLNKALLLEPPTR